MAISSSAHNVTKLRLTVSVAEKRIRQIAKETDRIKWSFHALGRMAEREIFDVDVLRALRTGFFKGQPERTDAEGEWKCKMTMKVRGAREIGVVVIILKKEDLFVKTVEWEDVP